MRVNKYFTENGLCSRREADAWVEAGRVAINGKTAKHGDQVQPGDVVSVDGKPVQLATKKPVVIAYNKPVGIECTSDPRVPDNIIAAVNYPERIFHIGRLDKMSEGLILLTNIGDLVNKILRSRFEHEKEYIVGLTQPIHEREVRRMQLGMDIGDDTPTKPCVVETMGAQRIRMVLTEGRNRQIRRMVEACGNHVARLKRIRIMNIVLGDLKSGSYRPLTSAELQELDRLTRDNV